MYGLLPLNKLPLRIRRSQAGFALIIIVIFALIAFGVLLIGSLSGANVRIDREKITSDALAKARDALIAYTVSQDDSKRPGSFPCPNRDAPGTTGYGTEEGGCTTIPVGRLPWKTLGIPELADGYGEPLWYALSGNFKGVGGIVNSDTRGTLTVFRADGTTAQTAEGVAVVFSAGSPLSGQDRSSVSALCTTTNTNIPANTCAANYLEPANGRNNATINGPFIAAERNGTFNDRLIVVTTPDFIPQIELRISQILRQALASYFLTNGYYPFAAHYRDQSDAPTPERKANCGFNVLRGRFPKYMDQTTAQPVNASICTGLAEWQSPPPANDGPPAWFFVNEWHLSVYYSVSNGYRFDGPQTCATASDCLTVGSNANVRAVFFTPGTPQGTITRPSNALSDYLEDAQNQDGWGGTPDDTYVLPTATGMDRDRIITLP